MTDDTAGLISGWWRRRAWAVGAGAAGMVGLGGFRGTLAGIDWWGLISGTAWVNPKTHWEFGVIVGWNLVLVLAGMNVLMRMVRGGAGADGSGAGGVFVATAAMVVVGECAVTAARWVVF
ncbi:MAG: hypothetical protein ACKVZJ_00325 [Phycisphaerales bacterium]